MNKKNAVSAFVLSMAMVLTVACSNNNNSGNTAADSGNATKNSSTNSSANSGNSSTNDTAAPADSNGAQTAIQNANASDPEIKAGSSVTVINPKIPTLDPTQWQGQILVEQGTLLEGLYGYNQNHEIVPKIATGYTVSEDKTTWTFTLRKDAKWSNGDPVTANDFYNAYMYQLDPKNTTAQLWLSVLNFVKNSYAYHAGSVTKEEVGLKVVDDYTLEITTTLPHAILGDLVLAGAMPINSKNLQAHPTDWFEPQNFVSNGPYTVKSFTSNGELVMVANPNYVGAQGQLNRGNVETIHVLPESTVPVEVFMAGKTDVALVQNTSDLQYAKTHDLKSQLYTAPNYSIRYLEWSNPATESPYDKKEVRQAIAKALQRSPIVDSVLNGMGGATNVFASTGWPTEKLEQGLEENVDAAKQLLKDAGYEGGKGLPKLTLYIGIKEKDPQGESIALALGQELQQNLGIQSEIKQLNETEWNAYQYSGPQNGAQPGFILASGATNWSEPGSLDMGATQQLYSLGTLDAPQEATQKFIDWSKDVYYKPAIQQYGDPDNAKAGVEWSDWAALEKAAKDDIAFLDAWTAKQPAEWQPYLKQKGVATPAEQWQQIVDSWKNAKTDADKHAAFVTAWTFVAPNAPGGKLNQNALDVQVYYNTYSSQELLNLRMWQAEFVNALTVEDAAPFAAKVVNSLLDNAYAIPLFYQKQYFLVKPGVTGVMSNPWAWGNFYEFQYLNVE
ncbi:peptide ABC transporter substrate-binding protein [Paenibacillus sp. NFR01]|uniref:peptide ABC transporter substrate-binding protein n=1 Tax=Paenibacillus sp. NFR01 TaxID=1566279 RepID=UPI0008C2F2C2|nr:peptide ABC transporter substrate-binding protein [Paenibacillus sp. NFR01]SET86418.1 peptide/nickel transport system substrate-binding protein [Paenibacillus sp. NFR01]